MSEGTLDRAIRENALREANERAAEFQRKDKLAVRFALAMHDDWRKLTLDQLRQIAAWLDAAKSTEGQA